MQKLHKRINDGLEIIALMFGLYLIFWPFLPDIEYSLKSRFAPTTSRPSSISDSQIPITTAPIVNLPVDIHRLIIPKIFVDADVLLGNNPNLVNQGIWHRPLTSTPNQASNTVLVGHRFQYTSGGNTFYLLDKLAKDDLIYLQWEGREFVYRVVDTSVVASDELTIEEPSDESLLTLYTCTPLWTSQMRLVVKAVLI